METLGRVLSRLGCLLLCLEWLIVCASVSGCWPASNHSQSVDVNPLIGFSAFFAIVGLPWFLFFVGESIKDKGKELREQREWERWLASPEGQKWQREQEQERLAREAREARERADAARAEEERIKRETQAAREREARERRRREEQEKREHEAQAAPRWSTEQEQALAKLGLKPDATRPQVKRRYRALAKSYHPDRGGTEKQMQLINAAYELLLKEKPKG